MPSKRGKNRGRKSEPESDAAMLLLQELLEMPVEALERVPFTIIHFEYAAAIRREYYPCELGMLQFSIASGVQDVYQTFVCPKPLPTGCYADAKTHADETHKIPLLGPFSWNERYPEITNLIRSFAGVGARLFCLGTKEDMEVTTGCLAYLASRSGCGFSTFSVMPITDLAQCLFQRFGTTVSTDPEFPGNYFQRAIHDYESNIRCPFHDMDDNPRCAQGMTFRILLNFFDLLADHNVVKRFENFARAGTQFISSFCPADGATDAQNSDEDAKEQGENFEGKNPEDLDATLLADDDVDDQELISLISNRVAAASTPYHFHVEEEEKRRFVRAEDDLHGATNEDEIQPSYNSEGDIDPIDEEMLPDLTTPSFLPINSTSPDRWVISVNMRETICGIKVEPTPADYIYVSVPKTFCGITVEPVVNQQQYL